MSLLGKVTGRVSRAVQRRALAVLYARGRRRESAPEPADPSILRLGERLRTTALDENRGRFSGTRWRFLLCTPPSLAAEVWFSDLEIGMRHAGVPVRRLPAFASVDAALLDEFRPSVVVALDQEPSLACIDLAALREHKRTHGCLRLFVSTRDDVFAPGELSEGESRRFGARSTVTAQTRSCRCTSRSAFPACYREWIDAGFRSVSVPQSANPIEDYPCDVPACTTTSTPACAPPNGFARRGASSGASSRIIAAIGPVRVGGSGIRPCRSPTCPHDSVRRGSRLRRCSSRFDASRSS